MKEYKTSIVTIPGWAEHLQSAEKMGDEASAFQLVPLIYRALNLRCNSLTGIPFRLMYGEDEKVWDNIFQTPLKTILWKTEASMLLTGSAFWLKQDVGTKRYGAQWLNPYTVTVKVDQKKTDQGVLVEKSFIQKIGSQTFGPYTSEQMVHFLTFNPKNDMQKGLGAATVALGSGRLMYYLRSFATQFFEGGAMPVTVLGVDINAGNEDIERARTFFQRMTTGIKNAFGVIALRGDVKPTTITPALDTLAMPEIRTQALEDIAWAFGIPLTMLTDAANYATAVEHRRSFYEETIIPSAEVITDTINKQFLKETGLNLEVHPEEMDIFQEDENQRSTSLLNLVNAGIPLEAAFEILGFEVSDEAMALIRAEEAKPIEVVIPPSNTDNNTDDKDDDVNDEMRKWKRKAIKGFEKNGNAQVEFESEVIPEDDRIRIDAGLKKCRSKEDIIRVFDNKTGLNVDGLIDELQRANSLLLDDMRHEEIMQELKARPELKADFPITINVPEPIVNINVEPTPIENTVNVPEGPAPIVENTVNVPQSNPVINVQPSDVQVITDKSKNKVKVNRDKQGRITGLQEE